MALKDRLKKFNLLPEIEEEKGISPEQAALCSKLSGALSAKIASIPLWFDYSKDEQKELILNFLNAKLNEEFTQINLTEAEKDRIAAVFLNSVYGFGPLDFLISQQKVNTIFVKSNNEIFIDINGKIVKSDIIIDKTLLDTLINKLLKMSNKLSPVITFRFNNLFVTLIKEPVCRLQIIIKKISSVKFNFEYFVDKQIINSDIADFFKTVLAAGKKFLISAPRRSGKTIFLNTFINEIGDDKQVVLFEDGALINSSRLRLDRYDIGGLNQKEQEQLLNAVIAYKPDFIFSDNNDIEFNIETGDRLDENTGFAACISADSATDALAFFTSVLTKKFNCSEQFAKIKFSKYFDYIIQLEKYDEFFVIKSISEVPENTAEIPVLTEKLIFNAGVYKYDFSDTVSPPQNTDLVNIPRRKLSFSARFADK